MAARMAARMLISVGAVRGSMHVYTGVAKVGMWGVRHVDS